MKYYMNNEQVREKQKLINKKILSQVKKIAEFCSYQDVSKIDLNHFRFIEEINDQLFENVDSSLDRMKKINNVTDTSLFENKKIENQGGYDVSMDSDLITLARKERP